MKFSEILKTVLTGVDGLGSSKRLLLMWIGGVIWGFVHVMLFLLIKPFPEALAGTVILYDVILIGALAGLNVTERFAPKDKEKP